MSISKNTASSHAAADAPHPPASDHSMLAESPFQALLESAPDAIVIVDEAGQIVLVNGQAEHMFQYDHAALIGQPMEILLPERLRARHVENRAIYGAEPHIRPMGVALDLVALRRDGGEFPVEISLSPLRTSQGMLFTSVIRDITERKQVAVELERQVQRRTAHLNALLQFSQELLGARGLDTVLQSALQHALSLVPGVHHGAIYLYDPAGQRLALRASIGFHALPTFSHEPELGLIGRAFSTRQTQMIDSVEAWADTIQRDHESQQLIASLQLPQSPSGLIAIPLVGYEQAIGVVFLLRSVGEGAFSAEVRATLEALANLAAAAILEERRTREAATLSHQLATLEEQQRTLTERLSSVEAGMLQAARLAAVGQLAASVAHEINNPLYAARNCLYLLEDDLPETVRDSQFLTIARDQLARIAGIIERMRDFYRPARGDMAPANLNELLEGTLALAELNTRHVAINIIFTPDPALPPVLGNADQLRQVFLNLCLNAIEAMHSGGTLTVRTTGGPTVAVVEVQDTGIGIPEDIRARLFEPFFTNKPHGTGLGLSISAHIVTQHGGQLEVDSTAGHGATFRVVLPYQPRL